MKTVSLSGSLRENVGKKDAKMHRKEFKVTCVLYGGKEQVHFVAEEKVLMKMFIANLRRNNRNLTPVIVFGRGRIASQIAHAIDLHPEWGLRVIRKLDLSISPVDFEELLKSCYVEEIFFCIPRRLSKESFSIDSYLQICEEMGRPARVFINISSATSGR